MKTLLTVFTSLTLSAGFVFAEHPKAAEARTQAKKLLAYYSEDDDRIEIQKEVTEQKPMKSPNGSKLEVLEVWGFIYKGKYRMRFYYAKLDDGAYLRMGEEIVEMADL